MNDIINIDDYIVGRMSELICVKCGQRFISWRPKGTRLKDIECENCGAGYIIETGEIIDDEEE